MRIAIFGMGYVGMVTAAGLASQGHEVCGVDVDPLKVEHIRSGRSPVVEPGIEDLVARAVADGRLTATTDPVVALERADVSLLCVGTPSLPYGGTDLSYLDNAVRDIRAAMDVATPPASGFHAVVVRSTVPPGTGDAVVAPHFRDDRSAQGWAVGTAMCPEFLREGCGLADFYHPPFVVVGSADWRATATLTAMFAFLGKEVRSVDVRSAEALKYACNAFHATKITFANEMARIFRTFGVDSREVMKVFAEDTVLNISSAYLKPGFAFGGSCLPKDLRALVDMARLNALDVPLLTGTLHSNELVIRDAVDRLIGSPHRRVAILGLSFKMDTDDLRESPHVELAERLLGKGFEVRIYDPIINPERLIGSNLRYVEQRLPHLSRLLHATPREVLLGCDAAVVSTSDPARSRGAEAPLAGLGPRPARRSRRGDRAAARLRGDRVEGVSSPSGGSPPRVLVIVQNLPVPFDRRVWLECQALTAAGYDVTVVCPKGKGDPSHEVLEGVTLLKYPPYAPGGSALGFVLEYAYSFLATARLVLRARRAGRLAVLQACNPPDIFWPIARWLRLRDGTRFVFDHHDLCPELYESRFPQGSRLARRGLLLLERATFRTADHVVSTNTSYAEVARRRGGRSATEVTVVRTGPDEERLRTVAPNPALRRGRAHLVAYIGVMGPQDGVDLAVRAAAHVVHQAGRRDVTFIFMGRGDCYEELLALRDELGLADHLELPGRVSDEVMRDVLSTAEVGLSPDPKNPLNDLSTMNKTLEYMAFGLPVVAYDLKETRVSAGEAATYVPSGDVTAYADAILALLDDPDRRQAMGRAGRRRVDDGLSWRHQRDAYVAVFDALHHGAEVGALTPRSHQGA
ncbi:nucleotide sugar dehydrogenase [Friedmanniella luteola]|uniref:UDP-glucose 6-dehydrogenase n=1 Tax=Friedmanniella luteola TaxID=546871 RepID=A0A1H1Q188_9ACTN|nr:nucleotide sugar dehydrogenase [Friedmanniella luteola]SDS17154.1 nucleotide sugar dehydrogenase [Friedmanniella luteola]